MESHNYRAYNLNIISSFEITGLQALPLPAGSDSVRIEYGAVPSNIEYTYKLEFCQYNPSQFLFCIPGVANYLAENGTHIRVAPTNGASTADISTFLMSNVFAAILLQRQILPIHAAAITMNNGRAAIFAGHSGIGKSTLAALFSLHGFKIITDDMTAFHFDAANDESPSIKIVSGVPYLKLWLDTLKKLGLEAENLSPVRQELKKYYYLLKPGQFEENYETTLGKFFIISQSNTATKLKVEQLKGTEKFKQLKMQMHRYQYIKGSYTESDFFNRAMEVAKSTDVFLVTRPAALFDPPLLFETLAAFLD